MLGIINLLEHIASFFLQRLDQGVEVFHSVIDHEGSRARSKLLTFLRTDQPGRGARNQLALGVGPIEGGTAPGLDLDSQVPLVPTLQRRSVLGLVEDAADASDSDRKSVV